MQESLDRYVPLVYLLAAVPYAWLGLYAWRKRPAVAVTPFAWAMLGMSFWSFIYGVEIFFRDIQAKLFFAKLEYISIVSIPVFLLVFAFEYTGRSHLLTARNRALIWISRLCSSFQPGLGFPGQLHGIVCSRYCLWNISLFCKI